jgi:hypothetical protein
MKEEMEGIKKYFSAEQLERQEKFAELSRKMNYVRETLTSSSNAEEIMELVKDFDNEFKNICLELKKTNPDIKVELRDYPAGKALYHLHYNPIESDESEHPLDTDNSDIEKFIEKIYKKLGGK